MLNAACIRLLQPVAELDQRPTIAAVAAFVQGALSQADITCCELLPFGSAVSGLAVEAGCDIARELYLGIVLDRASSKPVAPPPPVGSRHRCSSQAHQQSSGRPTDEVAAAHGGLSSSSAWVLI